MEKKTKYESKRGKFMVVYDSKTVAIGKLRKDGRYNVQILENVEELKDLFITIASVLNQIYGTDDFNQ